MNIKYLIVWFIVVSFLPNNAKLQAPSFPMDSKPIQFMDIDKDGNYEVIATYRITDEKNGINVLILKKYKDKWGVLQNFQVNGFSIDSLFFDDIDGDGTEEMLLGCQEIGVWNMINVYKLNNEKYHKVYTDIYSELKY
jgi:hypothetical protein